MLFGVHIFPTQSSFQPDELARAAEEAAIRQSLRRIMEALSVR